MILSILKRIEHTVGTKLGVTGPLNEQCSKSKVKRKSTRQKQSKHGPLFFVAIGTSIFFFWNDRHAIRHWAALEMQCENFTVHVINM